MNDDLTIEVVDSFLGSRLLPSTTLYAHHGRQSRQRSKISHEVSYGIRRVSWKDSKLKPSWIGKGR